jgi:hypothetical protein
MDRRFTTATSTSTSRREAKDENEWHVLRAAGGQCACQCLHIMPAASFRRWTFSVRTNHDMTLNYAEFVLTRLVYIVARAGGSMLFSIPAHAFRL